MTLLFFELLNLLNGLHGWYTDLSVRHGGAALSIALSVVGSNPGLCDPEIVGLSLGLKEDPNTRVFGFCMLVKSPMNQNIFLMWAFSFSFHKKQS